VVQTRIADRYEILGDIGAGGMGVVHRARDERLGRVVAIKLLPQSAVGDEHARRRLMREARAAAGLEHPGIVHVYDVGETPDGGAFLVMELVKGKSLRQHCEAGTLALPKRLAALVEIGRAIAFAHEQGFVHRDIKPDNVMIRDDGRAVVLDFGLAKSANEESATVTAKGSFVGTPAYMAPEQARGGEIDSSVDQFALAVTVFEALTGDLPWKGTSAIEIVSEILQGTPRCMRDLSPGLPLQLDDAIARALEKDPRDRFPSMSAFADALETAAAVLEPAKPSLGKLAHADTVAAPIADTIPAAVPSAARAASVSASVRPSAPRSKAAPKSALRWLALGGIAIAAAAGAGLGMRSRDKDAPPPPNVLADPTSTLACPTFKAVADDFAPDDVGWLGASASQLACERAQLVLGSSMRTKGPPDLLGLSRMPSKDFPLNPYASDMRDRTLAQAANASAWLDGSVEFHGDNFHVDITLRTKDGSPLGHGEGNALVLSHAVSKALEPIALPQGNAEFLKSWYGGASLGGVLLFHDLAVNVIVENSPALKEDCELLAARNDLGSMAPFVRALCAAQTNAPLPPAPKLDASTLPALTITASALRLYPMDDARRRELQDAARTLESRLMEADAGDARAIVAATAAEIWYATGSSDEARRLALVAVEASPKLVDLRGTPWHRAAFTSTDHNILASHAGWLTWDPFSQANITRELIHDGASLEGSHRAAVLARSGYWLEEYGHALILFGDLVKAGSVAAVVGDPTIDVELTAAQGSIGKAFAMAADRLTKLPATFAMSRKATYLALALARLGILLEQPVPAMDDFVTRFIAADPPVLTHGVVPLFNALGACLLAKSVTQRCVRRLRTMYDNGYFGAAFGPVGPILAGGEAFAAGDWKIAAAAWRTMFLTSIFTTEPLRDVVTMAFEHAGELDLAEKSDLPALDPRRPLSLAVVRSADRADKRGDTAKAKELAQRIVDKWSASDERPPCVDRMRKILAK
jgi:serine/threonine protein kinase